MKYSVYLFYVAVTVAYFGSTLGNADDVQETDCPLQQTGRRHELKILEELVKIQADCVNESISLDLRKLEDLKGVEQHRAFLRDICRGRSAMRDCIAVAYTKWTGCYNETMAKVFTIYDDLMDSSFRNGCADDGEQLAVITEGYHRFTENYRARNPFVRECIVTIAERLMMVARSPASLSTKIWLFYRQLHNFRQCFAEFIPEDTLVKVSNQHMKVVLDEMKCINPVDENLVLCKSVDSSTIDRASACPVRRNEEDTIPISMLLERVMFSCFLVYEPYGQKLSDASTREQFDAYFENYCRRANRVRYCMNETVNVAEICLHDPQFKNFKVEKELLTNVLDIGCFEQGKRLANMFLTLQNNTDETDDMMTCLNAAKSANIVPIEDPTRLYRIYQELPVARQCLVEKTKDSAYVDDVNTFINDVMEMMKCVDPQDGNIVLCKTLTEPVSLS